MNSTRSATTVQSIAECSGLQSENAAAITMGPIQAESTFSPNEIESTIGYFLGTTVCTVSVLNFDVEPF